TEEELVPLQKRIKENEERRRTLLSLDEEGELPKVENELSRQKVKLADVTSRIQAEQEKVNIGQKNYNLLEREKQVNDFRRSSDERLGDLGTNKYSSVASALAQKGMTEKEL